MISTLNAKGKKIAFEPNLTLTGAAKSRISTTQKNSQRAESPTYLGKKNSKLIQHFMKTPKLRKSTKRKKNLCLP
jgi:hypothetical protein